MLNPNRWSYFISFSANGDPPRTRKGTAMQNAIEKERKKERKGGGKETKRKEKKDPLLTEKNAVYLPIRPPVPPFFFLFFRKKKSLLSSLKLQANVNANEERDNLTQSKDFGT